MAPGAKLAASLSHWACTVTLGVSTRAGRPVNRAASSPSRVLPPPGGSTRLVRSWPVASVAPNASRAATW